VKVPHVVLRGKFYQYYRRVPKHLVEKYEAKFIRISLRTADPHLAASQGVQLNKKYDAEFNVLSGNIAVSPEQVMLAGKSLAAQHTLETFIDFVVSPAEENFAANQPQYDLYEHRPEPQEYLKPHQLEALKFLQHPDRFTLSDALQLYFQTHKRGNETAFRAKTKRDWDTLINLFGNVEYDSLSRGHARAVVEHLLAKGLRTSTVDRMLNTIRAVTQKSIKERELSKLNPFNDMDIPGRGSDSKPASVPTVSVITTIISELRCIRNAEIPLMIVIQAELGSRIGEISGLSVDDIRLDAPIPYVHFHNQPWRSLKNKESQRRVPLVGFALEAAEAAVALPRQGKGLFESYAKVRGNDTASAAANKRLRRWGVTTHSFRHAMKDRLREVGCPKDIRDAIQGHANGDVAETYGLGHTLQTMREWLEKVAVKLDNPQSS
jgi:integrase